MTMGGVGAARRYLDNAATSWPKPEGVWDAWQRAARENGAAAGRGAYREAIEAGAIRDAARAAAARFIGCGDPSRVALTHGATLGLNMAIHGLLSSGDHVVATAADHNATLRPLASLADRGGIGLSIVPCDPNGFVEPSRIEAACGAATRWVVISHASNVTGAVQDVETIAADARRRGVGVILDASQTLGQVPVDVASLGVDCLVAPAHKWLMGMAGAAMLYVREGVEPRPIWQGGTGTASESVAMPWQLTERLEPGTPDLPALAAFEAAIRWHESPAGHGSASGCRRLADACIEGLTAIEGVRVAADRGGPPIVAFAVEGYHPSEVASVLEQAAGVQVRSGFHCAALVHGLLADGAFAQGSVRASFGPFNTSDDVRAIVETVAAMRGTAGRMVDVAK